MSSQQSFEWERMRRNEDPITSHLAAIRHMENLSERRRQVLQLVVKYPGMTSGEYGRLFLRDYNFPIRVSAETPHKRLPELERLGLVARGTPRKCSDTDYECITWWPNEYLF